MLSSEHTSVILSSCALTSLASRKKGRSGSSREQPGARRRFDDIALGARSENGPVSYFRSPEGKLVGHTYHGRSRCSFLIFAVALMSTLIFADALMHAICLPRCLHQSITQDPHSIFRNALMGVGARLWLPSLEHYARSSQDLRQRSHERGCSFVVAIVGALRKIIKGFSPTLS